MVWKDFFLTRFSAVASHLILIIPSSWPSASSSLYKYQPYLQWPPRLVKKQLRVRGSEAIPPWRSWTPRWGVCFIPCMSSEGARLLWESFGSNVSLLDFARGEWLGTVCLWTTGVTTRCGWKIRSWPGGVAIALIQTLQECIFLSGSESEDVFAPRIVMET
jgi:hypothetical protein